MTTGYGCCICKHFIKGKLVEKMKMCLWYASIPVLVVEQLVLPLPSCYNLTSLPPYLFNSQLSQLSKLLLFSIHYKYCHCTVLPDGPLTVSCLTMINVFGDEFSLVCNGIQLDHSAHPYLAKICWWSAIVVIWCNEKIFRANVNSRIGPDGIHRLHLRSCTSPVMFLNIIIKVS